MDKIFSSRKPPMNTYQLLDAWKEQQRRHAGAADPHKKEKAIASAQTLFDPFVEGRKSSPSQNPGAPEKQLPKNLEALAKEILAGGPHGCEPNSHRANFIARQFLVSKIK